MLGKVKSASTETVQFVLMPDEFSHNFRRPPSSLQDEIHPCYRASSSYQEGKTAPRMIDLTKANGRLLQQLAGLKDACSAEDRLVAEVKDMAASMDAGIARQNSLKIPPQAIIYPLFQSPANSRSAGNMTPLDHTIVSNGGTTSTYHELPSTLRAAKKANAKSRMEQESDLLNTNSNLVAELQYHNSVHQANLRLRSKMEATLALCETVSDRIHELLEERAASHAEAISEFLSYWGIVIDSPVLEALVEGRIDKI